MDFNIELYKNMVPETMYEEHLDFYTLFTCVKLKYVRNSYRWNSKFQNSKWTMTNFDYEYANNNKCFENFKLLQSKLNQYRKIYRSNEWTSRNETEYINFIYVSMEQLVNNLSIPIRDNNQIISNLVTKYKNLFDEDDEIVVDDEDNEDEIKIDNEDNEDEIKIDNEEDNEEPSNKRIKTN
jgi:hypothetical protein